jgi:hypothetical protein
MPLSTLEYTVCIATCQYGANGKNDIRLHFDMISCSCSYFTREKAMTCVVNTIEKRDYSLPATSLLTKRHHHQYELSYFLGRLVRSSI